MLAVQLDKLHFSYGKNLIFEGLSLEVPQGSFCALVGRNGSGKSTLIKLMARLAQPKSGCVRVFGNPTDGDPLPILRTIGFVSEALVFTAPNEFRDILHVYRSTFPDWDRVREKRLFQAFRLDTKESFLELSRGQRMLFCFTLAACTHPKLYLIDEITSVLDPYNRRIVLQQMLDDVKAGASAVMATNIVGEIDGYADRIVFLENRQSALAGSLKEFCALFRKFRYPSELDEATRARLDAVLVGTEANALLYVTRRENLPLPQGFAGEEVDRPVLPMEAFVYLSQGSAK
jgi:ABC-2 type transport system ATP-binding protein